MSLGAIRASREAIDTHNERLRISARDIADVPIPRNVGNATNPTALNQSRNHSTEISNLLTAYTEVLRRSATQIRTLGDRRIADLTVDVFNNSGGTFLNWENV